MAARGTFSAKLAAELQARNMGYRTLARLIDPNNIETERRSIRKWIGGKHVPTETSQNRVTDALGMERGSLDADPEEDSLLDALMARLDDPTVAREAAAAFVRALHEVAARDEAAA